MDSVLSPLDDLPPGAIRARRVDNLVDISDSDFVTTLKPGDFCVDDKVTGGQRYFWFCCPGPCRQVAAIALRPVVSPISQDSWELSGTPDAPTLSPSINHVGCWHGWLRDGVFSL